VSTDKPRKYPPADLSKVDPECGCTNGLALFNDTDLQRCDSCDVFEDDFHAAQYAERWLKSAPQLLEALRECVREHDIGRETMARARAAIVKATGGES
jgi:hypothetical protein